MLTTLAACGQAVGGDPTVEGAGVAPVTLGGLGDLRSVDPCGLVRPSAFERHGDARPLERTSLDSCTLAVAVGRENVVVDVGEVRPAAPEGVRTLATLPGNLRLVRGTAQGEETCALHVLLSDGPAVDVVAHAQRTDTELTQDTVCGVGRAAAEGVAETLASGTLPRWDPPHNSLARLSACGLLPDDKVAGLVGASARDVTLYPAEHQCTWGSPGGDTSSAQLDLMVGPPLENRARTERIAGRKTLVEPTETSSIRVCTITTQHTDFAQATGDERELAVIRVVHPVTERKAPCETGRKLAKLAWKKLPAR